MLDAVVRKSRRLVDLAFQEKRYSSSMNGLCMLRMVGSCELSSLCQPHTQTQQEHSSSSLLSSAASSIIRKPELEVWP